MGWDPEALPARARGRPRYHQALGTVQRQSAAAVVGGSEIVVDTVGSRSWAPVLLLLLRWMLMLEDVSEVLATIRVEEVVRVLNIVAHHAEAQLL